MNSPEENNNNDDARLVGAAKPVIFSDKDSPSGSITLWPEPLSDKDNVELDAWVRKYYLFTQRSSIPDGTDEYERDRIERIAQETASTLTWYSGLGIRIMASVDGMTQIMYMSIRKQNPRITVEKIRSLLLTEENLEEANKAFEELNISKNPTNRGKNLGKTSRKQRRAVASTKNRQSRSKKK